MNKKRLALFAMATLTLTSLVACGTDTPSSSTGTDTSESTSEESSSSSSSQARRYIDLTLGRASIREGMTLIDGAVPHTVFHKLDGSEEDMGTNGTFTITNASTGDTYEGDEPLPAGNYKVKNRLIVEGGRTLTDETNLSVTEGHTDVEDNNGNIKGVKKDVDAEDFSQYTFMNYSGIDTLGTREKASGCMPSVGNPKILVIPVVFKNTSFGKTNEQNELAREILREAFFAENDKTQPANSDGIVPDTTPWESLKSYYKKASGGKLNIDGTVTPIYTYNKNDTDPGVGSSGLAQNICNEAIKYFKDGKDPDFKLDATQYDSDKDGYIDGVEMVYVTSQPTPGEDGSNSTWWNYTTYTGNAASVSSPSAQRIFFSRWDFLTNGYYTNSALYGSYGSRWDGKAVDAHTIIHETGHMMGAADYYSYADTNKKGPAGQVDMMDQNVGDHNAYTKMSYGWVTPWVVDYSSDDFEVTLPSYTDTKKFLIVPAEGKEWNGTPWDEYMLLEYYTPTGVNEEDSDGYPEWQQQSSSGDNAYGHGGTYRRPGLQMFHVDTRASSWKGDIVDGKDVNVVRNYTDTPKRFRTVSTDGKHYETAAMAVHSNTPNGEASGRPGSIDGATGETSPFREIHAIFPGTENSLASNSYYSTMGCMVNLFGSKEYYEKDADGDGQPDEVYGDKPDSKYGGDFYSPSHHKNWFVNGTKFDNGHDFPWSIEIVEQTDESVTLHFVNNKA